MQINIIKNNTTINFQAYCEIYFKNFAYFKNKAYLKNLSAEKIKLRLGLRVHRRTISRVLSCNEYVKYTHNIRRKIFTLLRTKF